MEEDKGIKEGQKMGALEVARRLKDKGIDIDIISECTGVSKEKIEKL